MKKQRLISLVMAIVLITCLFGACSKQNDDKTTTTTKAQSKSVNVGILKGPTGMGTAYLMEENATDKSKLDYNFTLDSDPNTMTAKMINGELDIASVPSNVASVLYNKTEGKVQILAVNTLGVLYLCQKGDSIKSFSDLKGKNIVAAGQGTTVEYVFNYILSENGLSTSDVNITYVSEHAQALTEAVSGKYDLVLIPEPFVTQLTKQNADFSVALDITEEWDKVADTSLPMGCVVVNTDFAKNNPDTITSFLNEYKVSVDYTNKEIDSAADLCEKYDIVKAAAAKSAIPNSNIVLVTGVEMKKSISAYYEILFGFNAASLGGAIPTDDFYYGA